MGGIRFLLASGIELLASAAIVWLVRSVRLGRRADDAARGAAARLTAALAVRAEAETELRRAAQAAEAANAAKTRYLVAVNHEIRSPLNAIYGYAQLLERGGSIAPGEAGSVIRRSAEHLANLVESLLEISRIESGTVTLRRDIVQLPALIDDVVDMFRMQAQAKGIALAYEPIGRLPRYVRTDEKRLRQMLINLLSNAVKYTREGQVTLSVRYRSQTAEMTIADTGIGIAPDDLERIFEPFERGSSHDALVQPGIGLGLAITRMLARVLGGDIVAASTAGEGSRFTLRLFMPEPLTPPADVAPDQRIVGFEGPAKTVLVVEDQPSQTIVLDTLLRAIGFTVYTAGTGVEGLALADRCQPDLALLDIQMPGISGWETAARLRDAQGEAIRIIMVSANAPDPPTDADRPPAHDAILAKPVDLEALLAVIGRVLQLDWITGAEAAPQAPCEAPMRLPPAADHWVAQLRRLARVGHVRAVTETLADLETNLPAAAPAVAAMRRHVDNFDFASLMRMLDDGSSR
ncbi:response regulator [Sphingomonas koreensis]|nr:response regulator [Sphingomonas koreensis]